MTTYKELFGKYVQNLSSDPTSTDAEGQIWYNSTTGTFRTALSYFSGNWASAPSLNTTRRAGGAATGGTPTATLYFGGYTTGAVTNSESFNGSAWTATPVTNTAAYTPGGVGTATAALKFGGAGAAPAFAILSATEKYNGTSWTSVNSMNTKIT